MAFVLANIELFAAFAVVATLLGLTYVLESAFGYQPTLPGDAVRLINAGASVLDLRAPAEFAAGHVRGAVNLAPAALAEWAGKPRTCPAANSAGARRSSTLAPALIRRTASPGRVG